MGNRIKSRMKKGIAMVMTICMIVTMVGIIPERAKAGQPEEIAFLQELLPDGGQGTASSPAIIKNQDQLWELAELVNEKGCTFRGVYFMLQNDIEITACPDYKYKHDSAATLELLYETTKPNQWVPIGQDDAHKFEGHFLGNGKTISGMKIVKHEPFVNTVYTGLFGFTSEATHIENLTVNGKIDLVDTATYAKNACAGIIVAEGNGSVIRNCISEGSVTYNGNGSSFLGGIMGQSQGKGQIEDCVNKATVYSIGSGESGGIVAVDRGGLKILDCQNAGAITGCSAGGIAGIADEVQICLNTGTVEANDRGLGENKVLGGIVAVGYNVEKCANEGNIKGEHVDYCGGIVGKTPVNGRIYMSRNSGSIENGNGICGDTVTDIRECYNDGAVDGSHGAIVYRTTNSAIRDCYSVNAVDLIKSLQAGQDPAPVSCYYWDMWMKEGDIPQTAQLQLFFTDTQVKKLAGPTLMADQNQFVGWDFNNVWKMAVMDISGKTPRVRPVLRMKWDEPRAGTKWEYKDPQKKEVTATIIMPSWEYGMVESVPTVTGDYDTAKYGTPATLAYYYEQKDENTPGGWKKLLTKPTTVGEYRVSVDFAETEYYLQKTVTTSFYIMAASTGTDPTLQNINVAIVQPDWYEGETDESKMRWYVAAGGSYDTNATQTAMYKAYSYGVTDVYSDTGYTSTRPKTSGTYVIRVEFSKTKNYNRGYAYQIFEIKKTGDGSTGGKKRPDVKIVLQSAWKYGEKVNGPSISSDSDYDKTISPQWTYRRLDSYVITTTLPTDAGTYEVILYLAETDKYTELKKTKTFTIYGQNSSSETLPGTVTVGYALPVSNQKTAKISSSVRGNGVEVSDVSRDFLQDISGADISYGNLIFDASGIPAIINRMTISRTSLNEIYLLMDRRTHINTVVFRFTKGELNLTKERLTRLLSQDTGLKYEFGLKEAARSELPSAQQTAVNMSGTISVLQPSLRRVAETAETKIYENLDTRDFNVVYNFTMPSGRTISDYEVYGVNSSGKLSQYPLFYQTGQMRFTTRSEDVYVIRTVDASGTGGIPVSADLNVDFAVRHLGSELKIGYSRVPGIDFYEVYVVPTSRSFNLKKPEQTISASDDPTLLLNYVGGKKVGRKTSYKVRVYACKYVNGERVRVLKSITGYVAGRGNKNYTNTERMTVKQTLCFLNVGASDKVGAKVHLVNKRKKLMKGYTSKFRYCSSNPDIAVVSSGGKITGVSQGTCTIYVYAKNGLTRRVTVTVR